MAFSQSTLFFFAVIAIMAAFVSTINAVPINTAEDTGMPQFNIFDLIKF